MIIKINFAPGTYSVQSELEYNLRSVCEWGEKLCTGLVEAGIMGLSAQREPFWWAVWYIPNIPFHFPILGIIPKTMPSQAYLRHQ